MNTLKDLSVKYATKQPGQVDEILQDAPILSIWPFKQASHAMWNVYETTQSASGAGFVDLNAKLPTLSADSKLQQIDLSVMGGEIEVFEDTAQLFGGKEAYFASKMPAINKKTGSDTEYALLYNNLRKYCSSNLTTNAQNATATGGKNYSIIFCRFNSEENTGLYSPDGFQNGAMLDAMPINGGNLYKNSDGKLVYGMRLKGFFGHQIASKYTVHTIFNVTSSKLPTLNQITDALLAVRQDANTFIFCHPRVKNYITNKYKGDILKMSLSERGLNWEADSINGCPFVTSYNFSDGAEADVSFG